MTNLQWHLFEIKLRSIYLIFSTICTFFLFSHYQLELIYIMGKPFIEQQQTFIFLELTEAFYTLLRISTDTYSVCDYSFLVLSYGEFLEFVVFIKLKGKLVDFLFFFFILLFKSEVFFLYFCVIPKICEFLLSFRDYFSKFKFCFFSNPFGLCGIRRTNRVLCEITSKNFHNCL